MSAVEEVSLLKKLVNALESVARDRLLVRTSGEAVKISGQAIRISGEAVRVSGEAVKVSGEAVRISGQAVRISGETVIAKVSGEAVRISGQVVMISGQPVVIVSGTITASISGQTVIAKISGERIKTLIPSGIAQGTFQMTNASGGTALPNQACCKVDIRNLPGNENVYIGAAGAPYSGAGYLLLAGESRTINIDNLNKIGLFGCKSGEYMVYRAEVE